MAYLCQSLSTVVILYHQQCKPTCHYDTKFGAKRLSIKQWKFNSLPNDNFFDWSKLKAFADELLNLTEKLKFVLGRVENIVGKEENAGYQRFYLFQPCFQKASF